MEKLEKVLNGLNDSQYEAVLSNHKRLLVLAGAGSGKTRTLTAKIAKLLNEEKAKPTEILALTFTRLAGKNMKDKIKELSETSTKDLFANTFHSFALSIIAENLKKIGLKEDFSLFDSTDRDDILRSVDKELKLKVKWKKPYAELKKIEKRAWDKLLDEYKYRMRSWNAISISDLLETLIELLQYEDIQKDLHDKYKYVFVDEFQDINLDQLEIIRLINPEYLMVIGDDAQSIYGWNGARVKNILEFEDNFQAHVIKLNENYRSTKQIVTAADNLINHSEENIKKNSVAFKEGAELSISHYEMLTEEIKSIARATLSLNGDYKDSAILCRSNKLAANVANVLEIQDIPVQLVSNKNDSFSQEIAKDIFKIMSVAINTQNEFCILKTVNSFENNLDTVTKQNIMVEKLMSNKSLFGLLLANNNPYAKGIEALQQFKEFGPSMFFEKVVEIFKVRMILDSQSRVSKIIDLEKTKNDIKSWEIRQSHMGKNNSIASFLRYLMLRDMQDKLETDMDAVKVMTIHASKGLEFVNVFIPGATENALERGDIEEQRRLFYVAITRAIDRVFISSSTFTSEQMNFYKNVPTNFIGEMRA